MNILVEKVLKFAKVMSVTKALGTLNLVSARGLDNGTAGALCLANQESLDKPARLIIRLLFGFVSAKYQIPHQLTTF